MKNIKLVFIALIVLAAYSCETYEPALPDFDNTYPAYVELASAEAQTVPEGGNINVTVTSRDVLYKEYTIDYSVTGGFETTGSVTVPSGVNQYSFAVPIDAGIVGDDPLSATLTLTGVSNDVALGRTDANLSLEVTITKFVPFVQDDYVTTFDCEEPGYGSYQCVFAAGAEPNVLTNTNFWDAGLFVDYTFSADFDQLITIEPQVVDYGGTPLTVSGSGTYDGVTQVMVVNYTVVDGDGGVWDDNTHTFTLP